MGQAARARARAGLPSILRSRLTGLRIAVDVQHIHRPTHPLDRGAVFTLPNGTRMDEATAATVYARGLAMWLTARGADVLITDRTAGRLVGIYPERQREAMLWGADAYVACHVNAGNGAYGMVGAINGNAGVSLAGFIVASLDGNVPELSRSQVHRLAYGDRGAVCLRQFTRAAVLLEPFFGDHEAHQALLTTPRLIALGETIGAGIARWRESQA